MSLPTSPTISTASGGQTAAPPSHTPPPSVGDVPHAVYLFDVDEVTYEFNHPSIHGAQVMAAAGIPETEGIIQVHGDGTRETVTATTVIELASGGHFKRRPRFKRG